MIYVCVVARNDASTVGLLLWKVRQVLTAFPREYQFLVTDDGSTDGTAELLASYQRVLPLSLIRNDQPLGYAAGVERLLRDAGGRSDRPRRDSAVVVPADFSVRPDHLPDLLRQLDSGADVVVGEFARGGSGLAARLVHRCSAWLLRPGISVPGVRDPLSGFYAFRLQTVRSAFATDGRVLQSDGMSARAELLARAAVAARQIAVVPLGPQPLRELRRPSQSALALAAELFRSGRSIRLTTGDS